MNEFQDLDLEIVEEAKQEIQDEILEVSVKKGPRINKTLRQKALRVMLKRSELKVPPSLNELLSGKTGPKIKLSKIGFISLDDPKDPLLLELAMDCPVRNRLNRDEIRKNRLLEIGAEIFRARKMFTPIFVCKNIDDDRIECISGRHRLAFLALVYGADIEVPVYMEMSGLKTAREATAVANDARPIKAMERASFAIWNVVGGDPNMDQDVLYTKLASLKSNISKYCVYSVIERGYPAKIEFALSELSSRPNGEIMTVSNVECFWNEALVRNHEMAREEFDKELEESVNFLNLFVREVVGVKGFDASQHLSANIMLAVGRYYNSYQNITGRNAIEIYKDIAQNVVNIGETMKLPLSELFRKVSRV